MTKWGTTNRHCPLRKSTFPAIMPHRTASDENKSQSKYAKKNQLKMSREHHQQGKQAHSQHNEKATTHGFDQGVATSTCESEFSALGRKSFGAMEHQQAFNEDIR